MTFTSPGSAHHTFDEWESEICQTFVPLHARPPRESVRRFRGGVEAKDFGTVMLAEVVASTAVVERTPRLIRRDDPEFYKFGLQVSGSCVIQQNGREAALGPGDFAIYDTSRPYRISFGDEFRMIIAMFPRVLVQLPAARMDGLTAVRLSGDQGLASLLTPLMRGLSADTGSTGGVIAAHLGDAVVDLVTAAFAQQLSATLPEGSTAGHRALVAQVYRFIDENLPDPDLCSTQIAAAHFVSVRLLQKVFEAGGESVTSIIRQRRLERCRRDLVDPALRDRPISTLGARWGFPDAAHFSRLFRSTFGVSPRDYRQAAVPDPPRSTTPLNLASAVEPAPLAVQGAH
ncbi:AraC-type DNA-binding protein [Actinokineospora alba]|uniref:AraC-type DNA-binding protein n=1 Tax=Actinokineospora alba TaxID=504798 RepID=A0A1H0L4J6_9PSEU|nr:helix-turn-helix domain-containing protein [Actinokineospora alba]TDP67194.1 AraC family transcriptional regulator [Actinokineospora alba]SDJ04973.1 AraC-type DNA-binding protein [Actinokineospora alba]SDO62923.1 AraC-type DNA-binding protein [Actinokineospora alba]